eukprot:COSAG06_NODE_48193_length_334_cov_0.565957_1_plen_106_part_01
MRSTMFEDCRVKQESFGVPRDYAKLANVGPLCPTTLALAHNGTQGNNSAHSTSLNALQSHVLNFELRNLRSKLDEASRLWRLPTLAPTSALAPAVAVAAAAACRRW